jgi:hypothetical protein
LAAAYGTGSLGKGASAAPALSFTLAANTGVMFVVEWDSAATFSSLVSTLGNTYVLVGTEISAFSMRTRVYRSVTTVTGSETVTMNLSSSVMSVRTYDIATGIDAANDSGTPTISNSPYVGTNVTPATADCVVMSACVNNSVNAASTFTPGNSYTKTQEETDASSFWPIATGYRIPGSASAIGGSWTNSQGSQAYVWNVAFTSAGGGGGGRVMRPAGGIGSGGMQTMGGGMQGRARSRRSTITVPANFHAFGNRHANHGLRV